MSEPASLYLNCPIRLPELRLALQQRSPRGMDWHDWDQLGWDLTPEDVEALSRLTGQTLGDFLTNLRQTAERPADWLFRYDRAREQLELGQLLFSEEIRSVLITFSYLRRFGGFASGPGFCLVQDMIYGHDRALAGLQMDAGQANLVAAHDVSPRWGEVAKIALDPQRQAIASSLPHPLHDDLDQLMAR